ncbi:chromate transporter [Clostridium coskatii]|uniref:Chromate transport protein n=1 Tax=Clostridium coskatii TaxID=1705578 RepID=A0ABX2WUA6_9CLOT|nr:chromate transporter [Clostridium coskatii]OBR93556.1 chromate transport protein [Clostridium coskatii]
MSWVIFFWTLLKSVLFSSGGYGPLPSLHSDFINYGWAGQKQFTESLAIGQITPGPNGLWVVSLCYLVAGLRGALLACIALLLPPLLILIVQRCYTRIAKYPATQGLLDGVVIVIASFSVIVVFKIFVSNGIDVETIAIASISSILTISRRVSTNVILLVSVLVGIVF